MNEVVFLKIAKLLNIFRSVTKPNHLPLPHIKNNKFQANHFQGIRTTSTEIFNKLLEN
jgi:hypothetical protein